MNKKRSSLIVIISSIIIVLALPAMAIPREESVKFISKAENGITELNNNIELSPFIPFDIYSDALKDITKARNELEKMDKNSAYVKYKDYLNAYFYANIAMIKTETAKIHAQAKQLNYKKLLLGKGCNLQDIEKYSGGSDKGDTPEDKTRPAADDKDKLKIAELEKKLAELERTKQEELEKRLKEMEKGKQDELDKRLKDIEQQKKDLENRKNKYSRKKTIDDDSDYGSRKKRKKKYLESSSGNVLIDARLLKKGPTYRMDIYDKNIFERRGAKYRLSEFGEDSLDRIIQVLNAYPDSRIKIVGHTRDKDYHNYSHRKAMIISRYLTKNEIDPERISYIGLGNREVVDTPIGYRRVDRVEIIISGISK